MRFSHILAIVLAIGAALWVWSGRLGDEAPASGAGTETVRSGGEQAPPPAQVRVMVSTARPYVVTMSVTGRTEAARAVTLQVETSGRIEEIAAAEGEAVAEGQLIARIAADDRPQRLARAEAMVERFRIAFDASQTLAQSGWRAETANAEAHADLQDARAQLAAIRLDIARTRITAPFAGVLEAIDVEIGDAVSAGGDDATIGRLFDLDPIVVAAAVSERQVGRLAVGGPGEVRLVTGERLEGRIRFVGRVAEPATRTFPIEIELPNEGHAIPAGMTAEVTLPLETVAAHLVSPSVLSLADDGTLGVKLVDEDDRVRFVPATVVANSAEGLWLAGLPQEAVLIVVGHEFVVAGQPVEAMAAALPAGAP